MVFVLLRSVEEHSSSITLMYSWGRLCLSLSHCKKITFQLRFFKNWLSKSHCCVLSLFDASYKLTFKADLQEFPMYNARNSVLENKKGFQKGRATTASRFQPFAFWLLSLSDRVFFSPFKLPISAATSARCAGRASVGHLPSVNSLLGARSHPGQTHSSESTSSCLR